mmetsp:Transcript_433/g.1465  ORF Transcript_433/g.1465 Transcript_433/m.1465 type:complete len:93 (+) Transcript_433:86-364(+)
MMALSRFFSSLLLLLVLCTDGARIKDLSKFIHMAEMEDSLQDALPEAAAVPLPENGGEALAGALAQNAEGQAGLEQAASEAGNASADNETVS